MHVTRSELWACCLTAGPESAARRTAARALERGGPHLDPRWMTVVLARHTGCAGLRCGRPSHGARGPAFRSVVSGEAVDARDPLGTLGLRLNSPARVRR